MGTTEKIAEIIRLAESLGFSHHISSRENYDRYVRCIDGVLVDDIEIVRYIGLKRVTAYRVSKETSLIEILRSLDRQVRYSA